jgi:hypothetical protein
MPAPSTFTWDSGNVNVVAPTPTHQTSGFATNEVPTSAETNGVYSLIAAWITYLNTAEQTDATNIATNATNIATLQSNYSGAKHVQITRRISPLTGQPISSSGAPGAGSYATTQPGAWKATAANQQLLVPIPVYAGEEIINVRALVDCGATDVLEAQLFRLTYSVGGGPGHAQLGSTATSAGHSSLIETLSINGVNELPASFTSNYYLALTATAFATAPTVYGIELDVSAP